MPYKGAAQGLMDLVGGHIVLSAQTVTSSAGQVRGGTLRGIAVTSKERMPDFPDMATFAELGHPEFTIGDLVLAVGPEGCPSDIEQGQSRDQQDHDGAAMLDRMRKKAW